MLEKYYYLSTYQISPFLSVYISSSKQNNQDQNEDQCLISGLRTGGLNNPKKNPKRDMKFSKKKSSTLFKIPPHLCMYVLSPHYFVILPLGSSYVDKDLFILTSSFFLNNFEQQLHTFSKIALSLGRLRREGLLLFRRGNPFYHLLAYTWTIAFTYLLRQLFLLVRYTKYQTFQEWLHTTEMVALSVIKSNSKILTREFNKVKFCC